ncbi:hypothetical protein BX616_009892 [Lobosporangium transversale]|uniref:Adhesin domain-containing protein n=1 Tax=Lobosporangium transversale TaxID=64571 RepID=A0A1Y2H1H7_9FUNG|nr:hypothetical protein BCR41DRAFT_391885 [Lobosporangium transversale]KAF9913553.1 hypothetical protein BX616_009892 [Lobosporangium transversale]ORZ28409.1 hypothetical protein BCR41DRAFT_391885 [Lobosporangium transversale]|eukprot:XP_021886094.1 hypothetical protein BCR41DRAFT_391885 [Lobosporangium transversale]
MSKDKKNSSSHVDWETPSDEQQTFGSQSPYAFTASIPDSNVHQPSPIAPQVPYQIPTDAPPMYSKDPFPGPPALISPTVPSAPPGPTSVGRHPQQFTPTPDPPRSNLPYDEIEAGHQQPQYRQPLLNQSLGGTIEPANYGATYNNPYPNSNISASNDSPAKESLTDVQLFTATPDFALRVEAIDDIVGNVLVKESSSTRDKDIRVQIVLRASSTEFLNQLQSTIVHGGRRETGYVRVGIRDSKNEEVKKRIIHGNCARADIEIAYPRAYQGTGKLALRGISGKFIMKMDPYSRVVPLAGEGSFYNSSSSGSIISTAPTPSFKEIMLELTNGDIRLEGIEVLDNFYAVTTNGHISGDLKTSGSLVAKVVNGEVNLAIDSDPTTPPAIPTPGTKKLTVDISTVNGHIDLNLIRRFLGRFSISSSFGRTSIEQLNNESNKDRIGYESKNGSKMNGWISESGQEPQTSSPHLNLNSDHGNIKIRVNTQKK